MDLLEIICLLTLLFDTFVDSKRRPPQYDAWIDMYAGDIFETKVKDYINLVDTAYAAAASTTTPDNILMDDLQRIFNTCCKLEYMFWDQAFEFKEWPL